MQHDQQNAMAGAACGKWSKQEQPYSGAPGGLPLVSLVQELMSRKFSFGRDNELSLACVSNERETKHLTT